MEAEPKLRTAVLPEYIKEAKNAAPIVVPNVSVLKYLIEYKIIKVGDVVTYTRDDGQTVTGPYKGK
jgi:plastocyanin